MPTQSKAWHRAKTLPQEGEQALDELERKRPSEGHLQAEDRLVRTWKETNSVKTHLLETAEEGHTRTRNESDLAIGRWRSQRE